MKKTTYIVRHVWSKGIGSEKRAQPFGSIKYPGQMPWYPGKALEDWPQHKCEQGGQRDSSSWPRHWIATSFFESRTRCRWVYPRQYDQIFRRISSGSKTKRFECCCEQTNCFFDVRFSVSYWICTKRVSLIGLGMLKARLCCCLYVWEKEAQRKRNLPGFYGRRWGHGEEVTIGLIDHIVVDVPVDNTTIGSTIAASMSGKVIESSR